MDVGGLEPPTSALSELRSNQLIYTSSACFRAVDNGRSILAIELTGVQPSCPLLIQNNRLVEVTMIDPIAIIVVRFRGYHTKLFPGYRDVVSPG